MSLKKSTYVRIFVINYDIICNNDYLKIIKYMNSQNKMIVNIKESY